MEGVRTYKHLVDLTELDAVLRSFYTWKLHADGTIRADSFIKSEDSPNYIVSEDLLAAQHPDLPNALRALCTRSSGPALELTWSKAVSMTIDYYMKSVVTFVDTLGFERFVTDITSLARSPSSLRTVLLQATLLTVASHDIDGKAYTFVLDRETRKFTVDYEVLEAGYPGWMNRWATGVDLDIPMLELMPHIFAAAKPSSPDLPTNIALD